MWVGRGSHNSTNVLKWGWVSGQELGGGGNVAQQGGPVQAHHASHPGHEEQGHETAPLAEHPGMWCNSWVILYITSIRPTSCGYLAIYHAKL